MDRTADERTLLEGLLDEYRERLAAALDDLDEDQARRRLVPSRTTLLGLVKHVTFVEAFWFHQVAGRPLTELGVATTPHGSWGLRRTDTVASVRAHHHEIVEGSRRATAGSGLDDVVPDRRGAPVSVRFVHLQVLRELAHHCGHADILREQILA